MTAYGPNHRLRTPCVVKRLMGLILMKYEHRNVSSFRVLDRNHINYGITNLQKQISV